MKTQLLTLDGYQAEAVRTDVSKGHDSASFLLLGLFGESGSVLTEVKKRERDRTRTADYIARVSEEIGDVLWYMSAVAARNDIKLSEIAYTVRSPSITPPQVDSSLRFADLQPARRTIQLEPSLLLEWRLIDFAEAVGQLVLDHRTFLKDRIRAPLLGSFCRVLSEILSVSNRVGIDLNESALRQLRKANERWPAKRRLPAYRDRNYPEYEQIPRDLEVEIREVRLANGNYFVFQRCNGINVGDRLTDNIADPDDYRFHDVFHYAYAAVLGWSPVTRALYKLKRKSNKKIDDSEDGARAILIEEGISTIVFNEARKTDFFYGVRRGKLSFDLLKIIRKFVEGYEVANEPYWVWEEAILQGYEAFRFLTTQRRGRLVMANRKIRMEPL